MINKRFLVPILALAAFGLPASASIVQYCSGSGCSTDNLAAFNNEIATEGYTYVGLTTFVTGSPATSYTDPTSGVIFEDFPGVNNLVISGGALSTPHGDDSIVLVIPATVLAIDLTVAVSAGLCVNDCPENETAGFLGFVNTGSPSAPWSVTISPIGGNGNVIIDSFNAAIAPTDAGSGGGAETPEVGTLLLIGSGLIGMRYMRRIPRRVQRRFLTPQTA